MLAALTLFATTARLPLVPVLVLLTETALSFLAAHVRLSALLAPPTLLVDLALWWLLTVSTLLSSVTLTAQGALLVALGVLILLCLPSVSLMSTVGLLDTGFLSRLALATLVHVPVLTRASLAFLIVLMLLLPFVRIVSSHNLSLRRQEGYTPRSILVKERIIR